MERAKKTISRLGAALLLALAACRAPLVVPTTQPKSLSLPSLVMAPIDGPDCVRTNYPAILDGEAVDAAAATWPESCLPTARPMADVDLLRLAEVTLEAPGPGRRALTSLVRGVVLDSAGWKRRQASWAVRIGFDQAGLEGTLILDAVSGTRFTDARGELRRGASFLAVPDASWAKAARDAFEPPALNMVEVDRVVLGGEGTAPNSEVLVFYDRRCVARPGGCDVRATAVTQFCASAQRAHCVEALEAEFRDQVLPRLTAGTVPGVILARKGTEIRWLTDGPRLLEFFGGKLRSATDLKLYVRVTGIELPPPASENQPWEDRFPVRDYYRFDEPGPAALPGTCRGFVVETDGTITRVCVPKVACHPPTAEQLKVLHAIAADGTRQVCESGDGGFSVTTGTGSCLCSHFFRRGTWLQSSCAPCTQQRE